MMPEWGILFGRDHAVDTHFAVIARLDRAIV
jgi:hypothetical protein